MEEMAFSGEDGIGITAVDRMVNVKEEIEILERFTAKKTRISCSVSCLPAMNRPT